MRRKQTYSLWNTFVFYLHEFVFIVINSLVIIVFIVIFYTMMMTFLSFCWIYVEISWIFSINHLIFIMIISKNLISIPMALFLRLLSLKMFLFTSTTHTKLMINRFAWLIVILSLFLRNIRMIWNHIIIHLTARRHRRQINIRRIFALIIFLNKIIIIIKIIRIIVLILSIITPFPLPSIPYIRQRHMLLFLSFYILFMCLIFIYRLLLVVKR